MDRFRQYIAAEAGRRRLPVGGGHLLPLCGHHWSSWVTARSYRLNNAVVVARHSPRMIAAPVFSMNQLGHVGGNQSPEWRSDLGAHAQAGVGCKTARFL